MASQHMREMLIAAFLDIKLNHFREILNDEETVEQLDGTPVDEQLVSYIDSLHQTAHDVPGAGQLCAQALALMCDATLWQLVDVFGKSPVTEHLWCGHKTYKKLGHVPRCAEMNCPNYINKHQH